MKWKSVILGIPISLAILFTSCSSSSPSIFSTKRTAHEKYGAKLKEAGLNETSLGTLWFSAAEQSLLRPQSIVTPFQEVGYFGAEKPRAASYMFSAKRGEKVVVKLIDKANGLAETYLDLWRITSPGSKPEFLTAADDRERTLEYKIKSDGQYLVRVQPELLKSIEYTISIATGPSLAYPLAAPGNNHIKSLWGVDRDGGARKHEGIDMFAPHRTPILASANGTINRVENTRIGGKVVWLRPEDMDIAIYYAHLDEQLVRAGERVRAGDTVGLMGNTGNAAGGPSHLHLGIYTHGGAIDPYTFVYRKNMEPEKITADTSKVGEVMKITGKNVRLLAAPESKDGVTVIEASPVEIMAATKNKFRVLLPDGRIGYVGSQQLTKLETAAKRLNLKTSKPLLDSAAASALQIRLVSYKEAVTILGEFNDLYFVKHNDQTGWMEK